MQIPIRLSRGTQCRNLHTRTSSRSLASAIFLLAALLLGAPLTAKAQAPWSGPLMQQGIASVTCAAPVNLPLDSAYTFALFDVRNPDAVLYGGHGSSALWNPDNYHHETWNVRDLGNVFGIALDRDGDMYVAAHGLYSKNWGIKYHHRYGDIGGGATDLAAAGTVYKIDRNTGVVSVFAQIPGQQVMNLGDGFNSGPGLGNIAYDRDNNQFFVTSLEDGIIYRISATGSIIDSFDPMAADDGAAGMPPTDERLWGIGVLRDQVYYGVWNTGSTADPSTIRRVNLNAAGAMIAATDTEILTVPGSTPFGAAKVPVSDIAFDGTGDNMVLGTRTMRSDTDSYNHSSPNHVVDLGSMTFTNTFSPGCNVNVPRGESYGGVDYGENNGEKDAVLWNSSADMDTARGPHGIYGILIDDIPVNGKAPEAWKVPYDPSYTGAGPDNKGSGGDVEILREAPDGGGCAELVVDTIECPDALGDPYDVRAKLINNSSNTAVYALLTPCPAADLPAGAITVQPLPDDLFALDTPIAPGESGPLNFRLPVTDLSGAKVCFRLTLLSARGEECCTQKFCVETPPCDCAEILSQDVRCELMPDGSVKYTISLKVKNRTNLTANPHPFSHANFLPPASFSPAHVVISPAIAPGDTGEVTTCYFGSPGGLVFQLVLHNGSLDECCSIPVSVRLPDCDPGGDPDTCTIEEVVGCGLDGTAGIHYTICNNGTVAKTYTWRAIGWDAPGCSGTLTAADFSPGTGTVTVGPGDCVTIPIRIRCSGLRPGDCAGYAVCATHSAMLEPVCCRGIVRTPIVDPGGPIDPVIYTTDGGTAIPIGGDGIIRVEVANPSATAAAIDLTFEDTAGVLEFDGGAGYYTTTVLIPAGGSTTVSLPVERVDSGVGTPPATSIIVTANGSGGTDISPDLVIPVLLPAELQAVDPGGVLAVRAVSVDEVPVSRVRMDVATREGRRYQVQSSSLVTEGSWVNIPCDVEGTTVDASGIFLGTGSTITAMVPCDDDAPAMFYRIVELN